MGDITESKNSSEWHPRLPVSRVVRFAIVAALVCTGGISTSAHANIDRHMGLTAVETAPQPAPVPSPAPKPDLKAEPGHPAPGSPGGTYAPDMPGKGQALLRVKVIDGRTMQPLAGAEVVLLENERRYRTDKNGLTPWIHAPVLRNARYRFMVRELHGQLTLISYKNGYRDSIHMGVRVNENQVSKTTIWQYKITPEDRRIEPVVYIEPYHRLWLIELADRFRRPSQHGEGYERP